MSFSDFNLKEDFITSIEAAGYESPTPLQSQLIPIVEKRQSALVWTQSASGKTGSFLIPAINYILENPAPEKRGARVLILTSRRDRVSQINYTIKRLSNNHTMRFGFIVSGRPYQTQMRLMRRPLDIMIATPGRLNDLMNNGKADFSQLEMLIVDDLTSIYQKNLHGLVESIINQAGADCPTLTFVRDDGEVSLYARSLFPDAVQIKVGDSSEAEPELKQGNNENKHKVNRPSVPVKPVIKPEDLMSQKVYIADDYTHKIAMMDYLMDEFSTESTIIYVSTYKSAKTLQDNLANHGHTVELMQDIELSDINDHDILIISDSDKSNFSNNELIGNDDHIIHFDLPRRTDRYLERLSQHDQKKATTAALLLIDGYNYNELKHIEKTIGVKLDQVNIPGLEPLKPFVNMSKSRPAKKNSQPANKGSKPNGKKHRVRANKNTKNNNGNSGKNKSSEDNTLSADSRRQRKGAFGRLNGGANRKKSGGRTHHNRPKVGVSSRGTGIPKGDNRGWQSDFAEPQERKSESKNVVIRYSNKRSLIDKTDQ